MDNHDDMAKEHSDVEPRPADVQPLPADLGSDVNPDLTIPPDPPEAAEPGAEGRGPVPSPYRLRPQGLRPVRRQLRRHGLRNDCPPDRRHPPRSPSSRTRLR